MRATRLFTPDEANALLGDIEPLVAGLREAAAVCRAALPEIDGLAERAAASGGTRPSEAEHEARQTFAEAQATLLAGVRELQDLGVWVKDVDRGLLDFPSERDGEVVELCWLHGEASVEHWHRVGEGFAGRKPL